MVSEQDDSRVWLLKTSRLAFSLQIFFRKGSGSEIQIGKQKHTEETSVQISALGSLHILRYTLFKLGFVTSPKSYLKQVFQVKRVYL